MNSPDDSAVQRVIPMGVDCNPITGPKWVDDATVNSWGSYRDAVLWAWEHRPHRGLNEPMDQSLFAAEYGVHAPHMSRYVSPKSKAPMDLKPDLIPAFECYTGWRAVSQYEAKSRGLMFVEELQARRAA